MWECAHLGVFCYPARHMVRKGVLSALFFVCSCAPVFAQGTTSRVVGTVQDPSGGVLPNASVKLVNEGTRVAFDTRTSAAGTYVFEAVQPGSYEIDVEAAGFRKFTSRGNMVTI